MISTERCGGSCGPYAKCVQKGYGYNSHWKCECIHGYKRVGHECKSKFLSKNLFNHQFTNKTRFDTT